MTSQSETEGYLNLVKKCNNFICSENFSKCGKFIVDGQQVGLIRYNFFEVLQKFPDVFIFKTTHSSNNPEVHLSPSLRTLQERTNAVNGILEKLRQENVFITLRGWRDEMFEVKQCFSSPTLLKMERAATCIFGVIHYGTHVNAYTHGEDGSLQMWIARRSPTKPTWPGKLDNMCAGGLPADLDVQQCVIKECQEEASVSMDYLKNLQSAGTVSYFYEDERGLFPETQFVYDLEVPSDFVPVNADGEVGEFKLVSIEQVKQLIGTDDFKPNCGLVILDFLVRHGLVRPDNEPNYAYLVERMHYPVQTFYTQ